jgi:hypothetical protein
VPAGAGRSGAPRCRLELGYAALITIEPMDVERAGMARTDLPALPGAGRRRGAAVGRDFADRQRLAAVLDDSGVRLGDVHGPWGGRVVGDGQWRTSGRRQLAPGGRGGFDALLTNC